jgi:hypothetical protein
LPIFARGWIVINHRVIVGNALLLQVVTKSVVLVSSNEEVSGDAVAASDLGLRHRFTAWRRSARMTQQSPNPGEPSESPKPSEPRNRFSVWWRGTSDDREPQPGHKTQRLVGVVVTLLVVGMLLVSTFLVQSIPPSAGAGAARAAGVVLFVLFGAAAAVGAAAGFLFGLPRSRVVDMTTGGQAGAANPPPSTSYLTNSNLIKVSDWLTTIIIGLGLVNLRKVPAAIEQLGAALKAPLGGMPYSATIGVSVVIGGGVAAFLLAYLWTSIRVRELLEASERESLGGVVARLEPTTMDAARRTRFPAMRSYKVSPPLPARLWRPARR